MKLTRKLVSLLALLLVMSMSCTSLLKPRPEKQKPVDKGGIELLIAVKADKAQLEQSIEQTMAVIQKRCETLNIYCKLQRQDGDKLILRFSTSMESSRAKNILVADGLELRPVVTTLYPAPLQLYSTRAEALAAAGTDNDVLPFLAEGGGGNFIVVERTPIVTGQDVRKASALASPEDPKNYRITFQLKPEGAVRLQEWSGAHINNYLAIIMSKQVRSAAFIKSQISDNGEIAGRYTKDEAEDIVNILMSGNLPVPIELLEEKTYRP